MNSFRIATLFFAVVTSANALQTPSTTITITTPGRAAGGTTSGHPQLFKTKTKVSTSSSHPLHKKIQTLRGGSSLSLSPDALVIAESLAPKLGILTGSALYLAPVSSVWKAIQTNEIGDLNPIPLTIMSVDSVAWLVYGLSIQDPYVVLSSIAGCIASIGFVFGLLPLLRDNTKELRKMQGVGLAGCVASLCLWSFLGLSPGTSSSQISSSLGLFASALFIVMSASPLASIGNVIATKNSSSILGPLTICQIIDSALWTFYGVTVNNSFVYGPSLIALGLGVVQLALKIKFPARTTEAKTFEINEVEYLSPRPSSRKRFLPSRGA